MTNFWIFANRRVREDLRDLGGDIEYYDESLEESFFTLDEAFARYRELEALGYDTIELRKA